MNNIRNIVEYDEELNMIYEEIIKQINNMIATDIEKVDLIDDIDDLIDKLIIKVVNYAKSR